MNQNVIGAEYTKMLDQGKTVIKKITKTTAGHCLHSTIARIQIRKELRIQKKQYQTPHP